MGVKIARELSDWAAILERGGGLSRSYQDALRFVRARGAREVRCDAPIRRGGSPIHEQ